MSTVTAAYQLAGHSWNENARLDRELLIYSCIDPFVHDFLSKSHGECFLISSLLFFTGLRISEVLNLTKECFLPSGFVVVRGLKKSRDRAFYLPTIVSIVLQTKRYVNEGNCVFNLSHKQFYSFCKKMIPQNMLPRTRVRNAVTHFFRYYYLLNFEHLVGDFNVSDFIGHRSRKSTNHYMEVIRNGKTNFRNSGKSIR
jgi:integrase